MFYNNMKGSYNIYLYTILDHILGIKKEMYALEVNKYLIKYASNFSVEKVILLIVGFKPLKKKPNPLLYGFGHCLLVVSK